MIHVRIARAEGSVARCDCERKFEIDVIRMVGHKIPGYAEWRDRDGTVWVTHESVTTWGHGKRDVDERHPL